MNSKTILNVFFVSLCLVTTQASVFAQYIDTNKGNAAPRSRRTEYSFEQIDSATNKLPANYKGNPLQEILLKIIPLYANARKNEFETTAEFNERLAKERKQPIALAGSLNSDSNFAFSLPTGSITYDADKGSFSEEINLDAIMFTDGKRHGLKIITTEPTTGGFGEFKMTLTTSYAIALPSYTNSSYNGRFKVEFPMSRDLARNAKNLGILVVGKIDFSSDKPVYYVDIGGQSNYYLNLVVDEAWLYDTSSGGVYVKQKVKQ